MKKIALSILILLGITLTVYLAVYVYAVYLYEPDALTQQYLDEKNPKIKMELLEQKLNGDEYERWAWLDDAAELAFNIEDHEKAQEYSLESLSLSSSYTSDWNYGNSIHNANMVLGRISLKEGKIEEAKNYLIKAAASEGSPQLDSFGPSLKLADELLKYGEKEAVLKYLSGISKFWGMDNGCVARWIKQIENNETPKLCNCSC